MTVDVHRNSTMSYRLYRLIHRNIRPFSVGLVIATLAMAWQYLGWHKWHEGPWAAFAGYSAIAVSGVLVAGWIKLDNRLHTVGLMLATAVWFGRMFMYGTEESWVSPGVGYSLAWAAACFLSWGAEKFDISWRFVGQRTKKRGDGQGA